MYFLLPFKMNIQLVTNRWASGTLVLLKSLISSTLHPSRCFIVVTIAYPEADMTLLETRLFLCMCQMCILHLPHAWTIAGGIYTVCMTTEFLFLSHSSPADTWSHISFSITSHLVALDTAVMSQTDLRACSVPLPLLQQKILFLLYLQYIQVVMVALEGWCWSSIKSHTRHSSSDVCLSPERLGQIK